MTPDELSAIRERAAKATAGPWSAYSNGQPLDDLPKAFAAWLAKDEARPRNARGDPHCDCSVGGPPTCHGNFRSSDAAFIAHARQDVPALLAEVARLRAALEAAKIEHSCERPFECPAIGGAYRCDCGSSGCEASTNGDCECGADEHNARIDAALRGRPPTA